MSASAVDQALVHLKHWFVGLFPAAWQPWVSILASIAAIILAFAGLFAVTTILERKGLGRMQNRYGPNRVGPWGVLQPLADGVKALIKEDVVPQRADKAVHFLAPIFLVVPIFLAYSVLPIGRNMEAIELNAGVLFFFAAGAFTELAVFLAGWSSRNKYALLGAMRAIAQMLSYELPLILSAVSAVLAAGSLDPVQLVASQRGWFGWHLFTPWGLAGFLIFLTAATAESNRTPFDFPEAESELVAGYFTEYSGFKFALFFLGEYLGMFAISGLAITLFLGGWRAPIPPLDIIPSYLWFFGKLLCFIAFFIWLRGTLPRMRMDQMMNFAWKFLTPMALITLFAAGLWKYWGPGAGRWIATAALVFGSYAVLGRTLMRGQRLSPRRYYYAKGTEDWSVLPQASGASETQ